MPRPPSVARPEEEAVGTVRGADPLAPCSQTTISAAQSHGPDAEQRLLAQCTVPISEVLALRAEIDSLEKTNAALRQAALVEPLLMGETQTADQSRPAHRAVFGYTLDIVILGICV
eukprot:COSAG01_NODE_49785_length_369_cov_0.692593_1_plen_115_part_01